MSQRIKETAAQIGKIQKQFFENQNGIEKINHGIKLIKTETKQNKQKTKKTQQNPIISAK